MINQALCVGTEPFCYKCAICIKYIYERMPYIKCIYEQMPHIKYAMRDNTYFDRLVVGYVPLGGYRIVKEMFI